MRGMARVKGNKKTAILTGSGLLLPITKNLKLLLLT